MPTTNNAPATRSDIKGPLRSHAQHIFVLRAIDWYLVVCGMMSYHLVKFNARGMEWDEHNILNPRYGHQALSRWRGANNQRREKTSIDCNGQYRMSRRSRSHYLERRGSNTGEEGCNNGEVDVFLIFHRLYVDGTGNYDFGLQFVNSINRNLSTMNTYPQKRNPLERIGLTRKL